LRALGVRASALTRAGTREQGVLLGSGIVLGAAAGLIAAWLALPAYPLSGDRTDGPPLLLGPAYLPILGVVVVVLVLAGIVAYVGARSVVRAGHPDRLREARG
jgi:putative ABC transport system permease protein